jgi:hypothetical protein
MAFECPEVQKLNEKLNISKVRGHAKVCPVYEPDIGVRSVKLFSVDLNYVKSLVEGIKHYLNHDQTITTCDLPMPGSLVMQNTHIHMIELNTDCIRVLCQIFGMDYSALYRDCEPVVNVSQNNSRRIV